MSTKLPVLSAHGLPGPRPVPGRQPRHAAGLRPVSLAVALLGLTPLAFGLPEGANTVLGQASVKQTSPGRLDIQQGTARAAIDWTRFSIGANEQVVISQPGRDAVLVNRVLGNDPSLVFGSLRANGTVWLVNPRGIVFGRDSQVDVGGLLASTLAIRSEDLATGRLLLSRDDAEAGALRSEGRIRAPDGSVVLVAPSLVQTGQIDARRIGLAAATQVQVDVEGDGLVFFNARNDGSLDARLQQLGTLRADGGLAELRAAARAGFADTVLNLEGVVQARSIGRREGRIVIDGGDSGVTRVAGVVDASGPGAGERGGDIVVLGQKVGLTASAALDASGTVGGGGIRVGGDYHGSNPDLHNAEWVTVLAGARLAADATVVGDGGRVVVWSDVGTRYSGSISARGGVQGGDGGFVEVSGKQNLAFLGTVDLLAPKGTQGQLLLDPLSISVVETNPNVDGLGAADLGNASLQFADFPLVASVITSGAINALLGGTVTLEAKTTLTVNQTATAIFGTGALILKAGGDISVAGNITAGGGITLSANDPGGTVSNTGKVVLTANLNAGIASPISISGAGTHSIGGNLAANTLTVTGDMTLTGARQFNLAAGTSTINAAIGGGGSLEKLGAGTLVLGGGNGYTGATLVSAGTLSARSVSALGTAAAGTTVASGATLEINNVNIGTEALSIAGLGVGGNGALVGTGAGAVAGGTLAMTAASRVGGAGTLGLTGIVSGNFALTKVGAGTLSLGGAAANTYTGLTTVSSGTLVAAKAGALGTTAAGTTVTSGATLEINNVDIGTEALSIAGVGVDLGAGGIGALVGTGTGALAGGTVALTADSRIGGTGTLGLSGIVSGNFALTKVGTGSLTLSGAAANTYDGQTTVNEGLLVAAKAGALGTTAAGTAVASGATLEINNVDIGTEALSLAGVGVDLGAGGIGALMGTGPNAVAGGTVALTADSRIGGGGTLGLSGIVSGNFALEKAGAGTLTLSGAAANTYTGLTTVSAGTLTAAKAGALGTAAAGTAVASGATLEINNVDIGTEALSLAGVGVDLGAGGIGALVGTGAGAVAGGTVALAADSRIGGAGTLGLTGVVSGNFALEKVGAGTLALGGVGTNTYSGTTTVSAGTLELKGGNAIADAAQGVTVNAPGSLLVTDAEVVRKIGGAGAMTVNATLTTGDGTDTTFSGVIDGAAGLTKQGTGRFTLSGAAANTYDGQTTVNDGTLVAAKAGALGSTAAGTAVASGATLEINNANIGTEALGIAGLGVDGGVGGMGALVGTGAGAVAGGTVAMTANSRIGGTGTLGLTGVVSGNAALTKVGAGTLVLSGAAANTYTGLTTVSAGTLTAAKAGALGTAATGTAVASGATLEINNVDIGSEALSLAGVGVDLGAGGIGALVGTGAGAVAGGTVALTADSRIGGAGTLGLTGVVSGNFALEKVGAGTLALGGVGTNTYSGTTTVSAGTLELKGGNAIADAAQGVTVNAPGSLLVTDAEVVRKIGGAGAMTVNATLTTGDGTDTTFSGVIDGAAGLTKQGTGRFTLSGAAANTYDGQTTVNDGTLVAAKAGALGSTAAGTAVASGATLEINNANIGTEALGIAGLGVDGGVGGMGALVGTGAGAVAGGTVAMTANSRIGGTGTLGLTGVVSGNAALTKVGAGTLVLSGAAANTYTGLTTVSAGTLTAAKAGALGTAATGTAVASGATLEINNVDIGSEALSLAGVGVDLGAGGIGALVGTGAGAVAGGTVALTADSRIGGAGTLGLTGVVSGNFALEKVGAGTLALGGVGTNTYSGTTTVSAGRLELKGGNAIADAAQGVTVNASGSLLVTDAEVVRKIGGAGAMTVNAALTTGDGTDTTFSGVIDGAAGLTKQGTGRFTLSGAAANTYDGQTTVNDGTLVAAKAGALGSTAAGTAVASGATLEINNANIGTEALGIAGLGVDGGVGGIGALVGTGAGAVAGGTVAMTANSRIGGTGTLGLTGVVSGNAALTKVGAGTLVLSGAAANTYTGLTTVSAGTLVAAKAGALGTAATGTAVASGATLEINNVDIGTEALSLAGVGVDLGAGGIGALVGTGAGAVAGGTVALTADSRIGGAGTLGLTGVVSGNVALEKVGAGTLTLSGAAANTYTGLTTVSAGTLVAAKAGALGTTATGTTVASGATLEINNVDIGTEALGIAGLGVGSNGALVGTGAGAAAGGTVALTADSRIGGAGTLGLTGVVSGNFALEKVGAGTLALGGVGTNTYSGTTTVSAGRLELKGGNAIADAAQGVTVNASGRLLVTDAEVVRKIGGAGAMTVNAALTTGDGTDTVFSGAIDGTAGLVKQGTGNFTLSGAAANTYDGQTAVNAGTLVAAKAGALGSTAAGTAVGSGATLEINNVDIGTEALGIAGLGVGSNGALVGTGAGAAAGGTVALTADSRIGGTGTLGLSGVVSGNFALTKVGAGTLTLSGAAANTYTGLTTVSAGTLVAAKAGALGTTATGTTVVSGATLEINNVDIGTEALGIAGLGVGSNGALVGTGAGAVAGGTVALTADSRIGGAGTLGLTGVVSGNFSLEKVGAGTLVLGGVAANTFGGATTVSAGTLELKGGQAIADAAAGVTVNAPGRLLVTDAEVVRKIGGAGAMTVNAALTTGDGTDTVFSGAIDGTAGLVKQGTGSFTLSGAAANTYAGQTVVNAGTLVAAKAGALGTAATGTTVAGGATLEINNADIGTEALSIAGLGVGSNGALVGTGAGAAAGGTVALAADSRIGGTGTLALTGVVSGNFAPEKVGAGTLTLSGAAANTYTGSTTVSAGTLALGSADRLPNAGTLLVAGSGVLNLGGFNETVAGVQQTGGTIRNGTLTSTSAFDLRAGAVSAILAGAVGLDKTTGGTVTLSGANTYTGTTTVGAGTLALGTAGERLLNTGSLVVSGGTLDLGGFTETVAVVRQTGGTIANGTLVSASAFDMQAGTASASLAGAVGLNKTTGATVTLSGANTYTGTTTVSAGTLALAVANGRLLNTTSLVVTGGTFDLGGFAQTLAGVQQTGGTLSNGTLTSTSAFDMQAGTASAVLAGTAGLAKTTAGTTTLSGANTYTGATTVGAGTLALGGSGERLANGSTLVVNGGTFDLGGFTETVAGVQQTGGLVSNGTLTSTSAFDMRAGTVSAVLAGTAGLDKTTAGTLTLAGANSYTGATSVQAGSLVLAAADRLADTSTLVVRGGTLDLAGFSETVAGVRQTGGVISNGTLTSTSAFDMQAGTASAVLAGTAGLGKTTAGTTVLAGANTYTGATTVSDGTLQLAASDRLANGSTLAVSGGNVDLGGFSDTVAGVQQTGGSIRNGTLTSTTDFDMRAGTASAVLAGGVGLTKTTAGTLTLSGANTYAGPTTVAAGTLALGTAGERLPDAGHLVVSGGSFDLGGFTETLASVRQTGGLIRNGTLVSTSSFDMQAGTASAVLAGTVGLTKTTAGTVTLSGANTYTGPTAVAAGTLALGASERLADSGSLVVSGGSVDLGGFTETVAAVQLAGGAIGNGTLTSTSSFDLQAGAASAVLAGAVGLHKTTAATVTLSGANSYTGTTTVTDGTLALGVANDRLPTTTSVVVNGGVFDLGGFSQTVAAVQQTAGLISHGTLTSTTAFEMQAGTASAVLAGTVGLNKSTAGVFTLSGGNSYTGVTRVAAGTLALGGAQVLASAGTATVDAGATLSLNGAQDLARLNLAGTLAGTGPLNTPDFRSTSGRIDLPLTAASLEVAGETLINTDATVGSIQVLAGGQLAFGVAGRLVNTNQLMVAPTGLLHLQGAQSVGVLTLGGTLDGSGTLTATTYALQGGQVLAALGSGALTSRGASLLDAPAAVTSVSVLDGTLGSGANASFSQLPAVTVAADAHWALGSSQLIGRLAGAGNVALGVHTLRTGAGGGSLFAGVIGGTGSLVKQGADSFTLAGGNTFTGGTVVAAGTLALRGPDRLADTGSVQVDAGATLSLDATDTVASLSLAGTLAGSGTLTAAGYHLQGGSTLAGLGRGALVSDGSSSLRGPAAVDSIRVDSGSLLLATAAPTQAPLTTVAAGASLVLAGDVTLGSLAGAGTLVLGNFTLQTGAAGDSEFNGVAEGTGSLVKQGDSRFTLSGANRYTGTTRVAQGTLALAGDDRLADGTAVVVAPGAVLSLAGNDTVASLLLQGTLAGAGTLTAATYALDGGSTGADLGLGALTSSGSSTLGGRAAAASVQVQSGQLTLAAADRLADGATVGVATGARLTLAGDDRIDTLNLRGTLDGTGTLSAQRYALDGGTAVADLGAGLLTSSGASQLVGRAAVDTVQVLDGSLALGSANRLQALPALSLQAGARLLLGGDDSLGSLSSLLGAGEVVLGGFTLSTGARADSTFGGVISGSGGIVKRGADTTFGLTGASTYSGSTRVAEGTLALGDGGNTGTLSTNAFVVDGVLQVRHADTARIDQPISGSGALEQRGSTAASTLVLQGDNKSHTGATRVVSGRLATVGDEALSNGSDLLVANGASLVLGGAETVKSINADGTVAIASRFSSTGAMVLGGAATAAGNAALTLEAASIDAVNAGNRWGSNLAITTSGAVKLSAGTDASGRLPLSLGAVQVGGGGRIEASTLALNGVTSLTGGTLVLDVDKGEVFVEPTGALLGKLTPANRQIAITQDVLTQGEAGRIEVAEGALLDVRASQGGSVSLQRAGNRILGGLAVVVGGENQPWLANQKKDPGNAGSIEYSWQNQVRVEGEQVSIGGAGIQADLVAIKAGGLRTLADSRIVAKLPYDNLVGTTQSLPALTLELTEPAFLTDGSFGQAGAAININVGSTAFGDRKLLPVDSGFLTVLPLGGARGGTALFLGGPAVAGTYSFFYSGAGVQGEIPVFYNGVSATTPQVSGSISSTLSVSEGARKERFEEAVRTENVALRLRAGVIAEVGPGTPATVNNVPMDRMRPPSCTPAPGTLACP